jgi:DNA-directed RNA polymerase specialized sigma24 family protein
VEVTAEELERLLALLDPDPERAAERYEAIRKKLIRLFEWRGSPVPEDLADVTFDRVARGLARGLVIQSADPYSYFCGVAFLVHKEQLRARAKRDDFWESGDWRSLYPPAETEEEDPRLDCLRHCLDRLPAEQRELLLGYHAGEDRIRSRQQLAQGLGDSLNALRIKVHRVRRQLESCLASCLAGPERPAGAEGPEGPDQ